MCTNFDSVQIMRTVELKWTRQSVSAICSSDWITNGFVKIRRVYFHCCDADRKKTKALLCVHVFFLHPLPDLPKAAVRILSNVTFLFVSLSYTAESAIVTAFITFIPKFIESQFGIPASNASIYTGELNVHILKSISPHHPTSEILQRLKTGLNKSVF